MVVVALRSHDPDEDARRATALADTVRLPMLANTRAEAEYVAQLPFIGPLLLVTSESHAYRALATFAKVMPKRRIFVAALRGGSDYGVERRKCTVYAAKGDMMTENEMANYLLWRDG